MDFLQNVTRFCFGASYGVAMILELVNLTRPRLAARWAALAFGAAGLIAHSIFLLVQRPAVATSAGSLLLLAWVVAVFYLYGALHHRRQAWAVFVLPIVLILVVLSSVVSSGVDTPRWFTGDTFWGAIHGSLLLLAAIGVSVGCVASVMYLVQAQRLKSKASPSTGLKMPSLERLATMNRRAVAWAFPLLTAGLLLGVLLLAQRPEQPWNAVKVLATAGLWLAFVVLLYLRYFAHSSNRRLAVLTIAVFCLLLVTLVASHPVAAGGKP